MNISILKPDKNNLTSYLAIGSFFIFISILDLLVSTFLNLNLTIFLQKFDKV